MPPRKILIGCPAKAGLRGDFATRMSDMLRRPECANMDFIVGEDASVAQCRNEFAYLAVEGGYEALVMIDQDLRWSEADFFRLLEGTAPVRVGIYCKKVAGEPYWLFVPHSADAGRQKLVRCSAVVLGFSFITTNALRKIRAACSDLEFYPQWPPSDTGKLKYEWFPTGVVKKRYVNEDFFFCLLAKGADIPILADTSLVIPHIGAADYPANLGAELKMPPPDEFYER